jgi:hypothetical protein
MIDINTLADSRFFAETHCFAAGAAVELDDSQLAGLHWQIIHKAATRKRQIITVAYKLRLLHPVHYAVLHAACLRPGKTLVATQLPPERVPCCPLTVTWVDIVEDAETCSCQVEITAVTCFFGGSFHAPMPEADTYMTLKK